MENPENPQPNGDIPDAAPPPVAEPPPTPIPPPSHHLPPMAESSVSSELPQKSPVLAAFLSIIPGLGNVYNGLYRRAIAFFLVYVALFAITVNSHGGEIALLVPCVVFVFFFNVFDAYRQATLINYGYRTDVDEARLSLGGWGLAPGIVLLVLGFYGLLRNYFDIDWDWLLEQWPWGMILFGGWLIFKHFKDRAEATAEV